MPEHSRTVEKAFLILETLVSRPHGTTVSALSKSTGLSRQAIYRAVKTMEKHQYVVASPDTGDYYASTKLLHMAYRILRHYGYGQDTVNVLEHLAEQTGLMAKYAIWDNDDAMLLVHIVEHGRYRIRQHISPGDSVPLQASSLGRAYLSAIFHRDPQNIVITHTLRRLPSNLQKGFIDDLTEACARGYAIDRGENSPDVCCVGSAVYDSSGRPLGAISVSGQSSIFSDHAIPRIGTFVSHAAKSISSLRV